MDSSNTLREGHEGDSKYHPLVSIITPTYNHENFIGDCIESVLAQTYPYWEQIIIDDGSTDRTGKIVAQYNDERLTYLKQDNIGIWRLKETYNKALKISHGKLIAVLEGDDFWPPDKLEKQIPAFNNPEVVLSWGKCIAVNRSNKPLYTCNNNLKKFKNRRREKLMRELLFHNFIPACTAMCRKDALLSIGGFQQPPKAPHVDYFTWLCLSLIGELKPVDAILGYWRQHENQVSNKMSHDMILASSRYAIAFFQSLPQPLRNSCGVTMKEMQVNCMHNIATMHFGKGRTNLYEQQWIEARKNFYKALQGGSPCLKTKVIVGLICSYLGLDMEWIAKLMHKPSLDEFH
ncbi:MAG: putative teichuronic acid biosynthesis glycosyltransferase TuaG [Firmicutes bacterium ADurb.Bin419]|nr:MAG: putative teichuronic acid biosynthesis glycosyltransferase TuaG [Firmicutes bacterium ADurb.Bin419]